MELAPHLNSSADERHSKMAKFDSQSLYGSFDLVRQI
jgi:hypothetical protein